MLPIVLAGTPNSLITEFSYKMNQIAWGVIGGVVFITVLLFVWSFLRKPLSRFMKVKKARVEILHIQGYGVHVKSGGITSKGSGFFSSSNTTVAVRFIEPKKRRRRTFLMSGNGIAEGDQGMLEYQGAYGLAFERDGSLLKDKMDRYYHFGFDKNKKETSVQKERKKRRYW